MTSMRHRQSSLVNDLIDSRLTVESALQFFRSNDGTVYRLLQ
jgi:hypothetical protein